LPQPFFSFNGKQIFLARIFLSLYLAITVAVIAHNHNHVPMWKSATLNNITDIWITCSMGSQPSPWTPTHNKNHHKFNNRDGDYTITYRISDGIISSLPELPFHQQLFPAEPGDEHLKHLYKNKRINFTWPSCSTWPWA